MKEIDAMLALVAKEGDVVARGKAEVTREWDDPKERLHWRTLEARMKAKRSATCDRCDIIVGGIHIATAHIEPPVDVLDDGGTITIVQQFSVVIGE